MIRLKLSFGKDQTEKTIDIQDGELLSAAVERALEGVPLGELKNHDVFNVVVNGLLVGKDFWTHTKLTSKDTVTISPKIESGDSGQIFKQILIVTVAAVASVFLTPATGATILSSMAVAAVTIGASLLLNALIPPPVPELGDFGGSRGSIDGSQMYAIAGQSNQMRRLGIVPKVYGTHRMFPTLAATPYTELAVDPDTGETIQYFYAIYDFGLGTSVVTDLKIGDTPLTTDSFTDFEYRLVDPLKPEVDEDEYDENLESEFKFYKTKRVVTPLSIALEDSDEVVQFSDENETGDPQEIVLDFICPRGLFGYSSTGAIGSRSIKLEIHFALVGTTDWRAYNDPDYVDSHESVGGTDVTDFNSPLAPDGTSTTYYQGMQSGNGSYYYNTGPNWTLSMYIKPNARKLLVPGDDSRFEVGAKVFYGNRLLGIIQSIAVVGDNQELTLDRIITRRLDLLAYTIKGQKTYAGSPDYTLTALNVKEIRTSRHESAAAVITASSTNPVFGFFRFSPKVAGQYQVRVKRVLTFGTYKTQTADDITWGGISTSYKIPPINSTKRHVFLELKIRATNQLNGHIQNLSGVVSSVIPIYDSNTQTWTRGITNNPAWVVCDLLTGAVNKKAVPYSRLHMDSIVEWAEYCAEVPTPPPSATYLEPRFQCNFILDYETTLQGVIAQVAGGAQASLNIVDGKYGILIDRLKTTPVQIFTPRNSRDFSATRLYSSTPHAVKVKYIDPQLNWEIAEVIVYDNGYNEDNALDIQELTSFACTNHEQAWRFGRYMIAQNKLRQETISILVDFENLVCTRGDYVQLTQDVMRVGGSPARVKDISGNVITIDDSLDINEDIAYGYVYRSAEGDINTSTLTPLTASTFELDGDLPEIGDLIVIGEVGRIVYDCIVKSITPNDDLSANLILVEKADAIFDYESTDTLPDYDPQLSGTSKPDFYPPKAALNLDTTENTWECSDTRSGYNYFVELVWDIPPGSVYEFFEIWLNDGRGYRFHDRTSLKTYRYNVDQARLGIQHGFKVVAVSASGKKLQLAEMPEVLVTPTEKDTPPSDVEVLSMNITNQVLQLAWTPVDDCDIFEYAIRFSPDSNDVWESTVPLQRVSKNVNSISVQARTGVYMVKAIDYAGNQSENAAIAITTIPNLFDLNVIETINGAPTFDGTFVQTELLGEAVILDEEVSGGVDDIKFYDDGYYTPDSLLDLDDVYTVRLQSQVRADGYKYGELMANWDQLQNVEHLNTATSEDWDVAVEYRATDIFAAMADWASLDTVDHINYGAGVGFTDWRPIPTVGDATGRIFQFRIKLISNSPNVTPRLFDATIKADMPDRIDSFENLVSSASEGYVVTYNQVFKGPGTSPNVQVSIDDAETGDYWAFDYKTLEGLSIRFYDKNDVQVSRQFDLVAKGYGRRHTSTI